MRKLILSTIVFFQKLLLIVSYQLSRLYPLGTQKPITWVVGVEEVAANIKYISSAIPDSYSVCLLNNRFYNFQYCFRIKDTGYSRLDKINRLIIGPVVLGFLIDQSYGFFYISRSGFLLDDIDARNFEFSFLKKKNKKIVCFFIGSEIRSPKLLSEFAAKRGLEVMTNYEYLTLPQQLTPQYEDSIRKLALTSETYADLIFNAAVDQMSYFTKKTQPFMYFYPDSKFFNNDSKFQEIKLCKICHAPSSPIIKGTQLVRAAIAKLKFEGYEFQYVELMGVKNEVVLEELRSTHIVLNEFYAFVPGLFGIEAMASHCALLTSADEYIETDLPPGSNEAWFVTKNYEIYDNLKTLLDHPKLIKKYADAGYAWACQNASVKSSSKKMLALLKEI